MGLYGYRIGCFSWILENKDQGPKVMGAVKQFCRNTYSNPPKFGSEIAKRILKNPTYKREWIEEVRIMAARIKSMRTALVENLKEAGSTLDWSHILKQIGMFSYSVRTFLWEGFITIFRV